MALRTHAAQVLVASNRGPVSYALDARTARSTRQARRRRAGLRVSRAIGPDADAVWVCAALGDGDREAVRRTDGRLDPGDTGGSACGCWTSRPRSTRTRTTASPTRCCGSSTTCCTRRRSSRSSTRSSGAQWASYEAYNRGLRRGAGRGGGRGRRRAGAGLPPGAGPRACCASCRPDLRIGHFSHTPWAPAGLLPAAARRHRGASCCGACSAPTGAAS